MHPLTSDYRALIRALRVEKDGEQIPRLKSSGLFNLGSTPTACLPSSLSRRQHLEEVLQTCWEQTGQDVIDSATGQFRKRLSLVVATSGGHIEHCFD